MAKKEVTAIVKLMCKGGQATPAPPVGPALGQHQVNIGQFVKQFNDASRDQMGIPLAVVLTVYKDRTFDMLIKGPPVSVMLKQAAGITLGAHTAGREKVGKVTKEQIRKIAEQKRTYMTAKSIEKAMAIIEGTAKSMGLEVVE